MATREDNNADSTSDDARVTFSVDIENGETRITMRGDRDTAVIVRSASGERIYLPPEDFDREARQHDNSPYQGTRDDSPYQRAEGESPYQTPRDSPYQGVEGDSPYQAARQQLPREGLVPTADGYRIRHPEPVTDLRVLR